VPIRRQGPTTAAPTVVFTDREKETLRVSEKVFLLQIGGAVKIDLDSVPAERSNKPSVLTRSRTH